MLEPPPVAKVGVSTKNWNVLSDKSSVCDDSEQIIDLGCGTSRRSFLTDSCLLNEVASVKIYLLQLISSCMFSVEFLR